ncbi:Zinc-finger double-stranded RNA-binding domain-containing protein [Ceratobasidium sp. AG-Ba]|nr:Zinc-finger double-stranded RNA-binding domain-containing protein [Ceratobasidium sp. AG-Ba]
MSEKVGAYGNKAKPAFVASGTRKSLRRKQKKRMRRKKKRMQENDELMKKGKRPRKAKEELPKPTELMKQREHNLELDKNLNKTIIVQNAGGRGPGQPGFYCDLCQRTCKDTSGYLDHVNSRQHLRRLGQTTQVARSTLDQDIKDAEIAAREEKKRRKQEKNKPVETEEVKTEEDDTMASMMGFGGFGSSKK